MKTKSTHISARAGLLAAALLGLSTLAHAANMPDGTYEGTLSCGAGQATDIGPAFTAPTRITVSGNKLTWSRQTASMKEVVSGSLVEGKAILEGYGGSVSANTKQAFWDWRLKAQLTTSEKGVSGEAQIYSKDGSMLQRACKFAAVVPGGAVAEASIAPSPMKVPPPTVATEPTTPAAQSPTKVAEQVSPVAPLNDSATKEIGQREAALKQKELDLARREREAALRERELALRANEKALAAPTNVAEAPTAAAPLPTPKALVEPVNAQVVSSPSPVVAAAPAVLDVPTPAESEAKVEVIPAVPTRLTNRVAVSRVEEPAKAKPVSAPGTGTPQKFSNGTSDVLLTSAVIAMLLALAAIGWKLYPRYFQSRSEHYYSSPWERLKKRSGFVATFCFFSVMAIAAVVSILRGA
jgi:hypothetical protein